MQSSVKVELEPSVALVDQAIRTVVSGVPRGASVTLRASMGPQGWRFRSSARFIADQHGTVDLASQAPLSGTYEGIDPMGLYWSMEMEPDAQQKMIKGELASRVRVDQPVVIRVDVDIDGQPTVAADLVQHFMLPPVTNRAVRENGIVGSLFSVPGKPQPGVIVFSGSEGGLNEYVAATLASNGFSTLALGYFNFEGLPNQLCEIPLEYFEKAIDWFLDQDCVSSEGAGVIGGSKGGELSLLLGATFRKIHAVVAFVPSGVTMMGIPDVSRGCWSYRGQPLPFIPAPPSAAATMLQPDGSFVLRRFYIASIKDKDAVERATIPVENTNGPIMMVSGGDDQAWPSFELAEIAVKRLKQSGFRHPYTHLTYPKAGHAIVMPYLAPFNMTRVFYPFGKFTMVLGGTRAENVAAAVDSWPRAIAFFREHLPAER
jgi:dienelactone hydrolase